MADEPSCCVFITDKAGKVHTLYAHSLAACAAVTDRAEEIGLLRAERAALIEALHDAIRRPMGVVPDSAARWYENERAAAAESRRPRIVDRPTS